jgi:hypothetical protein
MAMGMAAVFVEGLSVIRSGTLDLGPPIPQSMPANPSPNPPGSDLTPASSSRNGVLIALLVVIAVGLIVGGAVRFWKSRHPNYSFTHVDSDVESRLSDLDLHSASKIDGPSHHNPSTSSSVSV